MGEYIAGTVGQCQRASGALASRTKEELCAGAVGGLVHHTSKAAEAGINLKRACSAKGTVGIIEQTQPGAVVIEEGTRLYAQDILYLYVFLFLIFEVYSFKVSFVKNKVFD